MKYLALSLLALLLALPSRADDATFTRTWVPGSSYYSCGHYYSTPGYYSYAPYVAPVAAVPVYSPNWKSDLIKFLEVREDRLAYENSLKAIGLPVVGVNTYQPSALAGSFGINTSTIYGYQPQSLAQFANPFAVNLDQALLSYFQANSSVQDNAKVAHGLLDGTINNVVGQAANLSAFDRRVNAALQILRTADGPPIATSTSTQFKVESGKVSPAELLPPAKEQTLQGRWNASAQRCVACHNGAKIEGGFDVAKYPSMQPREQLAVISRLVLPKGDPKSMPKGGDPISSSELQSWIEVMSATRPDAPKLPK